MLRDLLFLLMLLVPSNYRFVFINYLFLLFNCCFFFLESIIHCASERDIIINILLAHSSSQQILLTKTFSVSNLIIIYLFLLLFLTLIILHLHFTFGGSRGRWKHFVTFEKEGCVFFSFFLLLLFVSFPRFFFILLYFFFYLTLYFFFFNIIIIIN